STSRPNLASGTSTSRPNLTSTSRPNLEIASSITTDGPTVHSSQTEVVVIGVLGGVLVVLLLVAVICVAV
ncbi:hypothetical protein GBAR_LOCUS16818, partial [Geodia barretti]